MVYDNTPPDELTLQALARLASYTLHAAAPMLRRSIHTLNPSLKPDGSEITEVDREVNRFIIDALATDSLPNYPVLGEEISTEITDLAEPVWVLDPIDGTFPYTAGIGVACISLTLVVAGNPVLAVVEDPWTATQYLATSNAPTTRNTLPVAASIKTDLSGARIGVSAGGLFDVLKSHGAKCLGVGASVRLGASVADGTLDAHCFGPGEPWDTASALLMVPAAGGVVLPVEPAFESLHAAKRVPRIVLAGTIELANAVADIWRASLPPYQITLAASHTIPERI